MGLSQSKRRKDRWVDCNTSRCNVSCIGTTVGHCWAIVRGKKLHLVLVSYAIPCSTTSITWRAKLTQKHFEIKFDCEYNGCYQTKRFFYDYFSLACYQEKKTWGETSTGGDGGRHVFSHCGWVSQTEAKDEGTTSVETFSAGPKLPAHFSGVVPCNAVSCLLP